MGSRVSSLFGSFCGGSSSCVSSSAGSSASGVGPPLRLAVVGARAFSSRSAVAGLVRDLVRVYGASGFVLVSGGCRGVDSWAVSAARELGVRCDVVLPSFPRGSPFAVVRRALLSRSARLVRSCDGVFAFLGAGGLVGGTGFAVSAARRSGVPVRLLGVGVSGGRWGAVG